MFKSAFKVLAIAIQLSLVSFYTSAQSVIEPTDGPAEWSKPYPAFRIAGNFYYVGTYDLACYLITTPKGNILINTGLSASLSLIKANIEALGFKFRDTKILLTTQAHYDHMGAMAAIKKLTGAKFMVDENDRQVAEDGGKSDYAVGAAHSTYEPVKADRLLHDRDTIKLGNMQVVIFHHPGHTKGSSSFYFDVKDQNKNYRVLIANMPTIVTEKRFSEVTQYPEISKDYAYTLAAMKKLNFDLWVSSHASQFGLHGKHQPGDAYRPEAFMDRKGYDDKLHDLETEFLKRQ